MYAVMFRLIDVEDRTPMYELVASKRFDLQAIVEGVYVVYRGGFEVVRAGHKQIDDTRPTREYIMGMRRTYGGVYKRQGPINNSGTIFYESPEDQDNARNLMVNEQFILN